MYAAAMLRNVPPVEYLLFGFADPARRQESGQYLYWMDQPALQWLNRRRGAQNADVQDKGRFAALCREAGLPHAEVLVEFRGGRQVSGPESLPQEDLWSKPLTGSGGGGCRLWRAQPDGAFLHGNDRLSREQWIDTLRHHDCIVQRPLQNHPDLTGMTSGPAIVLRLVTVLDRAGEATLIGASLALPQGKADSTAGALGCIPDLVSGFIQEVSVANSGPSTAHPDTGVPLVGRVVPLWSACCDLVLRAHREAFPAFASLGWDVVVTPDGPVLLETNSGWGTLGQQMHFGPLGRGPLGRIAAEELERAA